MNGHTLSVSIECNRVHLEAQCHEPLGAAL